MKGPCQKLLDNHVECMLLQRRHDDLVLKQKYFPETFTLHDWKKLSKHAEQLPFCANSKQLLINCYENNK